MKQYIGELLRKWSNKLLNNGHDRYKISAYVEITEASFLLNKDMAIKIHKKELIQQIAKELLERNFINTNVGSIDDDWIKSKFAIKSDFKFKY